MRIFVIGTPILAMLANVPFLSNKWNLLAFLFCGACAVANYFISKHW